MFHNKTIQLYCLRETHNTKCINKQYKELLHTKNDCVHNISIGKSMYPPPWLLLLKFPWNRKISLSIDLTHSWWSVLCKNSFIHCICSLMFIFLSISNSEGSKCYLLINYSRNFCVWIKLFFSRFHWIEVSGLNFCQSINYNKRYSKLFGTKNVKK